MSKRLRKSESESQFERRRRALEPGHLRQPDRDLPQIIERGEIDPPVGRQPPLETGKQRLDVEHAVAEPIADDGVGPVQPRSAGGAMASPTSKPISGCRARARATISGR